MDIKTKIYLTLVVWLVLCGGMFLYGFKILDGTNRAALNKISSQKDQLLSLQAEAENFRLAQQDLQDMAKKPAQPNQFFSEDVTLVNEIERLENLGQTMGIQLSIGGIGGTVNTAAKAKTKSTLYLIPYSLSVNGTLRQVVDFMETLENLEFITSLHSLAISTAGGSVNASMSSEFYIHQIAK